MVNRTGIRICSAVAALLLGLSCLCQAAQPISELEKGFASPPESARPWVYWFWVNRMIGDENLPEDSSRNPDGTLKEWPAWVREGKPSPTGRYTFTSWRLWKGNDPLLESGLLGPVTLRAAAQVAVK